MILKKIFEKFVYSCILCMNISKLVDVASELIILLAAHLLESAHRIHMFYIASCNVDYDPKLKHENIGDNIPANLYL